MDEIDLDNVLNESAEPEPQQQPEAPPEEVKAETAPRDEKGRFAPKGEEQDAPPASDDKARGLEAAVAAERKKRQQLEQELEALRQPKEPPAPPPSIWEDDQAALGHVHNSAVQAAVQQATYQSRLAMSEMLMSQQVEDFTTIKDALVEFVGANPAINQQVAKSQHPWHTAYQAFKSHQTMTELAATNVDELKAKLTEQIKAELAKSAPPAPIIPQSLADAQSARGGNAPAAAAPLSLEEILGR